MPFGVDLLVIKPKLTIFKAALCASFPNDKIVPQSVKVVY